MSTASEIYRFAVIARLAYLDDAKKQFNDLGYADWWIFDVDGAQAHIAANEKEIIVAFRGTEPNEFNDIKADLKAYHKDGFHGGFYNEYKKLQSDILDRLNKLQRAMDRPIYITGHSLGGAMATVAAYHMPYASGLYTFGSPRAVSIFNKRKLKVPHYRTVNNNDIVPKVPMTFMGFKHCGTLQYLNFYGNIRKMTYWQRVKDSWRGRRQALKKGQVFDGIYDHSMDEYCRFLSDGD